MSANPPAELTIAVEAFDPQAASSEERRALYDLGVAEHLELWSEDPVPPFELWEAELLDQPAWRRTERFVVWDGDRGSIVGQAGVVLGFTETNRDQADLDVYVRAERRREGIAAALARAAIGVALADGRTMLNGGGVPDTPGAECCDALGAQRKITERKSRMVLAELDRSMLEEWVVRATERAVGYSLLAWDGPAPDEYLAKFVDLTMVMNTAPRDDLEVEDWVQTPERHREREQRSMRHGYRWWTLVARHDASDELVGFTEIVFPPHSPEIAWQEATAVDPTHRDRGLGRLLKATNALRLLDEKRGIRFVDTWNAYSNAPMLGINIAMGFTIVNSFSAYQIRTEELQARLG